MKSSENPIQDKIGQMLDKTTTIQKIVIRVAIELGSLTEARKYFEEMGFVWNNILSEGLTPEEMQLAIDNLESSDMIHNRVFDDDGIRLLNIIHDKLKSKPQKNFKPSDTMLNFIYKNLSSAQLRAVLLARRFGVKSSTSLRRYFTKEQWEEINEGNVTINDMILFIRFSKKELSEKELSMLIH